MSEQKQPIAILSLGIGAGILIYETDYEDVTFAWEINGERKPVQKSKIRYNLKDEPFFITKRRRYYLKNFLRTNMIHYC